jgi:hypothetical protein
MPLRKETSSNEWAWTAKAEIMSETPSADLVRSVETIENLPWATHVETQIRNDRVIICVLIESPDYPGAVVRATALLGQVWDVSGERVVALGLRRADA